MDKINKALLKLRDLERKKILVAFERIVAGNSEGLNIKKLKGHTDLYRLRVGDNRLIYRSQSDGVTTILFVGKRDDRTYHNF